MKKLVFLSRNKLEKVEKWKRQNTNQQMSKKSERQKKNKILYYIMKTGSVSLHKNILTHSLFHTSCSILPQWHNLMIEKSQRKKYIFLMMTNPKTAIHPCISLYNYYIKKICYYIVICYHFYILISIIWVQSNKNHFFNGFFTFYNPHLLDLIYFYSLVQISPLISSLIVFNHLLTITLKNIFFHFQSNSSCYTFISALHHQFISTQIIITINNYHNDPFLINMS